MREPAVRPVAAGPPVPGLNFAEAAVAVANAGAIEIPTIGRVPVVGDAKPEKVNAPQGTAALLVPAKPVPPAILPDDTRPHVRAEDFLPFFQIPGAAPAVWGCAC